VASTSKDASAMNRLTIRLTLAVVMTALAVTAVLANPH